MANYERMEEQVQAWRASGLSAAAFSAGKGVTASGLRGWAFRLRRRQEKKAGPKNNTVRLARVIREDAPVGRPKSMPAVEEDPAASPASPGQAHLVVETQGVRIAVAPGFDPQTLASVLDVLAQRSLLRRVR